MKQKRFKRKCIRSKSTGETIKRTRKPKQKYINNLFALNAETPGSPQDFK